ncbi:hypothetical protein GCM10022249_05920 [Enteractinococcus coprophilus]
MLSWAATSWGVNKVANATTYFLVYAVPFGSCRNPLARQVQSRMEGGSWNTGAQRGYAAKAAWKP